MFTHETLMSQCLTLAAQGFNFVSPNPLVGCVIVDDGEIIGQGYHQTYGKAHAEVNAIQSVTESSRLQTSTLYVNLEPCAHFGKTPPCVDLILHHKIPTVVIANQDPFEAVAGKSIQKLREAGVTVYTDVLSSEAQYLNKAFFTRILKKRPFVTLKWAESADGFIAPTYPKKFSISGEETTAFTQQLRAYSDVIMVGKNTLWQDNPHLTVRGIAAKPPIRIVVSTNAEIPTQAHLWNNEAPTWYFYPKAHGSFSYVKGTPQYVPMSSLSPESILTYLYQHNIQHVLIEGGTQLLQQFITAQLFDEVWIYKHKTLTLETGVPRPQYSFSPHIHTVLTHSYVLNYFIPPIL